MPLAPRIPVEQAAPILQQKIARACDRAEGVLDSLNRSVGSIMNDRQLGRERKYIKLVELTDKIMPAILPETPCGKGCSSCCHIACAISSREAELIGQATGRQPAKIGGSLDEARHRIDNNAIRFYGQACPFLVDNACSIYESRPLACRIQHSLNETSKECVPVPGQAAKPCVPQMDLMVLTAAAVILDINDGSFGDIREFFP